MRLTDLDPRWIGAPYGSPPGRRGLGISFDCPVCRTHRLAVAFANPIDGGPPLPDEFCTRRPDGTPVRWQRQGETFETLSLSPSIDATKNNPRCWHGFITNGSIV